MEIWKDIAGYKGIYQISNFGRVKSFARSKQGDFLKTHPTKLGYFIINIKNTNLLVHRLVAKCFIKNPKNKKEVNHIDGNKSNNNFSNLEWSTRSENMKHAYKTGLRKPKTGDDHHQSKLSESQVLKIRELKNIKTQRQIAEMFDVCPSTIWRIHNNKIYKY